MGDTCPGERSSGRRGTYGRSVLEGSCMRREGRTEEKGTRKEDDQPEIFIESAAAAAALREPEQNPTNPQPSQKTFRIKQKLAKKARQNRPIPQWFRLKTDSESFFWLMSNKR